MLFLFIVYLIALIVLSRLYIYLNLHFLKVNHEKNCRQCRTPQDIRKQSWKERKAKIKATAASGWVVQGGSTGFWEGNVARAFTWVISSMKLLPLGNGNWALITDWQRSCLGFLVQVSRWLLHYPLYSEPRFTQPLCMHGSLLKLIFSLRISSCFFTYSLHERNSSLKLMLFVITIGLHL